MVMPTFAPVSAQQLLKNFVYQETPSTISVNQAYALIQEKGAIVIDVRSKEEYEDEGHIEGAYLFPSDALEQALPELAVLKEKNTPVMVYCYSGQRSGLVMRELAKRGFKYVMLGASMNSWPYELTSEYPQKSFKEAVAELQPLPQYYQH